MSRKSVLWLGFGEIARCCAPSLIDAGFHVDGVARTAKTPVVGCQVFLADIGEAMALNPILARDYAIIVITLTPDGRREEDYKKAYLLNVEMLLENLNKLNVSPEQIIFVSSTSVYGDSKGEVVDELVTPKPSTATAKMLWMAEQLIEKSPFSACILRFSGIYGPGRFHLLRQVRDRVAGDATWTNRIHSDDCAGVLFFLIQLVQAGEQLPPVLLASDDKPVRSKDLRYWLAEQLGYGRQHLTAPSAKPGSANRRCDNSLLRSLGYQFKFPDYTTGFVQTLAQFQKEMHEQSQQ